MWAEPMGPGRFRLLNSSFFAPLAVGDVVSGAERRRQFVITNILEPSPMALSVIEIGPCHSGQLCKPVRAPSSEPRGNPQRQERGPPVRT